MSLLNILRNPDPRTLDVDGAGTYAPSNLPVTGATRLGVPLAPPTLGAPEPSLFDVLQVLNEHPRLGVVGRRTLNLSDFVDRALAIMPQRSPRERDTILDLLEPVPLLVPARSTGVGARRAQPVWAGIWPGTSDRPSTAGRRVAAAGLGSASNRGTPLAPGRLCWLAGTMVARRGISVLDLAQGFAAGSATVLLPDEVRAALESLAVLEHRSVVTATDLRPRGHHRPPPTSTCSWTRWRSPCPACIQLAWPGARSAGQSGPSRTRPRSKRRPAVGGRAVLRITLTPAVAVSLVDWPDPFDPDGPTGTVAELSFDPPSFLIGTSGLGPGRPAAQRPGGRRPPSPSRSRWCSSGD
jgi:hypothetical protein